MTPKVEVQEFEGEGKQVICSARSDKDICNCPDDTSVLVPWTIRGKIAEGESIGSTSLGEGTGDDRRRFLPSFKFLSRLALAIDVLSMIPEGVRKLVGRPSRKKLPSCIGNFKNLETIHVDNNGLKSLENIEKVKGLKHLSANNNKIKKIIDLPSSLKYLSIAENEIERLDNISNLRDLEFLNASGNDIESFFHIKDLDSLKILDVSLNKITDWSLGATLNAIQNEGGYPPNLESINASYNNVHYQPFDVETRAAKKPIKLILGRVVTHIDPPPCDDKDICSCPITTGKIKAVNKGIKKVPSCISKFKNLRILDLSNNEIGEIPKFERNDNLEELVLAGNRIKKMEGLNGLRNLKGLYLNDNEIGKIENIEKLIYLEEISLANNKITVFDGLQRNDRLLNADLSNNEIKNLDVGNVPYSMSLNTLNLEGNGIPKEQCVPRRYTRLKITC